MGYHLNHQETKTKSLRKGEGGPTSSYNLRKKISFRAAENIDINIHGMDHENNKSTMNTLKIGTKIISGGEWIWKRNKNKENGIFGHTINDIFVCFAVYFF